MASRSIVVIGAGPAGTFAAIAAKKQAPDAAVTLLSDEAGEPYEKPPLSKAVLTGKARPSDAPIAGPGGVAAHGVSLASNVRCTAIEPSQRRLVLQDGSPLSYDALVIATGARVRELPVLPASTPGVYYLRTEEDAARLKAALGSSRELLVVGGGLIGLEVAASAAELGVGTTVVEAAPHLMARVCYAEIAGRVEAVHRARGVQIRLNSTVTHAEAREDGRVAVETADGDHFAVDAIVVGTGAVPDDRLAAAAGLATRDGVVVDERCRTSDPLIYAAGDVARLPGPAGLVRLENWRHALDHGTVAGRNAAGAEESYRTVPSFWSEQYDLYIQGIGWPAAEAERVERPLAGGAALVMEVTDDRIVYALGINARRELAVVRRLIERAVPVDPMALADPARPLQTLLPR
ncbi:MAG TPA: FAD-dependent oxidoreductase [Vicinamibacterales bacterium]|nr:FAD-dependent oxidoreductase [Vicinamibacterales bacterium]